MCRVRLSWMRIPRMGVGLDMSHVVRNSVTDLQRESAVCVSEASTPCEITAAAAAAKPSHSGCANGRFVSKQVV
jgi:hypothetical protein